MKLIITTASSSIDAAFDQRFGRCAYFLVIDSETMHWEAFPNPGIDAPGGAGTRAAQFAVDKQVSAVISGNFGPNASSALNAAGISMYMNKTQGSVRDNHRELQGWAVDPGQCANRQGVPLTTGLMIDAHYCCQWKRRDGKDNDCYQFGIESGFKHGCFPTAFSGL